MRTVKDRILDHFKAGEFETAIGSANESEVFLSGPDIYSIMDHFDERLREALLTGDAEAARRTRLRIDRFTLFCDEGFDANALIPLVDLRDGYRGKILLVSVCGGVIGETICLRSGDVFHRDILRNTELEIRDLGLASTQVFELGGAFLCSEPDGAIRIWGGSDDFGPCDKELAAGLIRALYPNRLIIVEH